MSEERNDWPDTVYISASEATGKIYGHLHDGKGRMKYTRAALAGAREIGREEMAKIVHGTSFGVIRETSAGAVFDALSLNNMKIIEVKP